MVTFRQRVVLALIAATGVIVAAGVSATMGGDNKPSSELKPSVTATSTTCDKVLGDKVCVADLTVQVNSNELQQVKNHDRLFLKSGDTLRLSNVNYCIPSQAQLNKVEVKGYLFKNGVESYKNGLLTPSTFPINAGCHHIGNFQQTWKLEPGQHRVSIPIIKYVGSNRIIDGSFYFDLDAGE
ncbi:hypothetical protein H6G93_03935 [Nostoc sp. FACHB-973]|uniref:Lipoprotein n=1 Tax=Desmonostoc muscorum LEGE 12446 TaxID=1828758 RepID=A0A8J7DI75_DESMC|nr:hypothetical protein [Desmonostoc muscorum]MBD2514167.1 hypothetical protein [Nostoc sp. FACHB-973]MCF2149514.1 hypothetical protein [Desmonostoc muscorum LEGE 12446]